MLSKLLFSRFQWCLAFSSASLTHANNKSGFLPSDRIGSVSTYDHVLAQATQLKISSEIETYTSDISQ